ncbi:MAG: hypothetical protein A3D92_10710 [Bacteroidetes bacterium RIFCSPHIGHO2_02_FULL_44_7]|nr:MAG: hypothetical protein A3D92_10710 [Bacteroidetes bacterium RIFCSPHIGHO2_02_FULL_44_7]
MKSILPTLIAMLLTFSSVAQMVEVKFKEASFANGMVYPLVVIAAHKSLEDSINADILRRISDLEASDFCIGQYGYVQKSTHLQIHLFCNCIDFEESENRYFLYNLEEGRAVPYSDLLNPKERTAAGEFLAGKMKAFAVQQNLTLSDEDVLKIQEHNLNAMKVEMTKDGLRMWLLGLEGWTADKACTVSWIEMKPFLKYNFM